MPVLLGDVDFHVEGGEVQLPHHVIGGHVLMRLEDQGEEVLGKLVTCLVV